MICKDRGQALVEFALILPLFLTLLVGGFWVFEGQRAQGQLQHAADEASIAAAEHPGSGKCDMAQAVARSVLGHMPSRWDCDDNGPHVDVLVGDDVEIAIPFVNLTHWSINVTSQAFIRATATDTP